jgi:hypothetical protein
LSPTKLPKRRGRKARGGQGALTDGREERERRVGGESLIK